MDREFNYVKLITWSVGILIALAVILTINPFVQVDTGEVGVVLNWGAYNGRTLEPGLHFITPIAQSVAKMSVQTQKYTSQSQAYSKDTQVIDIKSALNYSLDAKSAGTVYSELRNEYETRILAPRLAAAVKQVIAQYTAEQLPGTRAEAQEKINIAFKASIPAYFLNVSYILDDESFSDAYEASIERKQVAQQDAERAENELKKAEIDAKARIAQAEGEARAISIQAQAINSQGGADYVQLKAIEKWNGGVPTYMMGNAVPFINLNK